MLSVNLLFLNNKIDFKSTFADSCFYNLICIVFICLSQRYWPFLKKYSDWFNILQKYNMISQKIQKYLSKVTKSAIFGRVYVNSLKRRANSIKVIFYIFEIDKRLT